MAEATVTARAGHLTPTERRILAFVIENEGKPCSKAMIAKELGRNQKTIDRLVAHLRKEGYLVVEQTWAADGGQAANAYRLGRAPAPNSAK